jgi:hypothetical protein
LNRIAFRYCVPDHIDERVEHISGLHFADTGLRDNRVNQVLFVHKLSFL